MRGTALRSVILIGGIMMLIGTALFTPGCKKTETTPPAGEEATAAMPKIKQNVDLQLVEDGFVSPTEAILMNCMISLQTKPKKITWPRKKRKLLII